MQEIFSINAKVQATLAKLFALHRLVFWYDDKAEMTELFNAIEIEGVEKLVIDNNEFTLKHQLLIKQPTKQFLLYQSKPKPIDSENWLLDLLLSNYEFHTEASSLYLHELELPQEFKKLIQQHEDFFTSEKRIKELKALLEPEDRESKIRQKMVSVICVTEPDWDKILYSLFAETLKGKQEKLKLIDKFQLNSFFWEYIEKKYSYSSPSPAIKDFLIQLVNTNFERSILSQKPSLNKEAYLFINRWKENSKYKQIFADWSRSIEKDLGVESLIQDYNIEQIVEADTYEVIDKKIIIEIRDHLLKNTLSNYLLQEYIEKRKVKFFYTDFNYIYDALSNASSLLDEIRNANLNIDSPKDGFDKYEKQWFKIDRLYRKYFFAADKAEHQNLLKDLSQQVEKAYGNTYLLKLGDNWQATMQNMNNWEISNITSQKQFYNQWVAPIIKKDNRIFVIISDAFRFESASELKEIILKEERYTATLNAVLGSIPSYTQLGMASLLPHTTLSFQEESDIVFADGMSTQGTANRTKVLQKAFVGSIAINAEDFLKMNAKTDGREFLKPFNVVYIYSNQIDKTGDDKVSEGKVFEATEDEFTYLIKIMKHINNMNGYNMIVTADHGYLYQNNVLEQSDFTDFSPTGKIYKSNRRFVLGKDLVPNPSVQTWQGKALGFNDDTQVQIPKSINRIRIQGAGSRFVHGGASLQEIVIPVLEINKARKDDLGIVDVDIISGSSNITSNSFAVSFYQKQPVLDKIFPRLLKAGFYSSTGILISDIVSLLFNSIENDAIAREKRQIFNFTSKASSYNGQDVYLKLEELIDGTNQYRTYKSITFRMLIAFSSEFDD